MTARPIPRVLAGSEEPIFSVLPNRVLANFSTSASENALVWNLIYPLARPVLSLKSLMELPPLWGTPGISLSADWLVPFFWGYSITGERLPHLDQTLDQIDGSGNQTEVDLFLLGESVLILIEAKHRSGLGSCSRYLMGRCPEIHTPDEDPCRYWEEGDSEFGQWLNFGERPHPEMETPPCDRHYQLGRTLLVGKSLAQRMNRELLVWMILPRARWPLVQTSWLDFVDRVKEDHLWRRMRVLSWEDVRDLSST